MGCGGSKLEPEQEARLRPILRRRMDEFLARRNTGLSKKQLLAGDATGSRGFEGEEEEEEEDKIPRPPSASDDGHTFLLTQDSPPTPQKINSSTNDNNSSSILCPKVEDKNDVNDMLKNDTINVDEINHDNNIDKEAIKEEGCTLDENERSELLSPGSPSFRVYCVHSLDEELDDIAGQLDTVEECIHEDDKNWLRQESSSSNKVVEEEEHVLKKHKKGRKFKMTIPKGGRQIFHNMHSLYHLPCTSHENSQTSHENSHLIQQAAA